MERRYTIEQGKFGLYFNDTETSEGVPLVSVLELINKNIGLGAKVLAQSNTRLVADNEKLSAELKEMTKVAEDYRNILRSKPAYRTIRQNNKK